MVIKGEIYYGLILAIGAVDSIENHCRIFNRSGNGADFVHAPAKRHSTVATHATESRTQAGGTGAIRGRYNGAVGFGTNGKGE